MRFLVDNALSPVVARVLSDAGAIVVITGTRIRVRALPVKPS
jgi:predicted nuclease of predicted toxin-antitoxin system